MGLFDYIKCEMPLPEGAECVSEWQTKDLECYLHRYVIRADGTLIDESKPGIPENHTGSVNFYGYDGPPQTGLWWEFCAFVENGKVLKIVQIEPQPTSATTPTAQAPTSQP